MKIFVLSLFIIFASSLVALVVPFISFDNKSYDKIAADAATLYNLDINDYDVRFQDVVVNAQGQSVEGIYRVSGEDKKETIVIKTSWSRPMVIAAIFHEFAHAAQNKHNLEKGDLTIEQHAEQLAFETMWASKYRYNAIHMLTMHSLGGKPSDYATPNTLWSKIWKN